MPDSDKRQPSKSDAGPLQIIEPDIKYLGGFSVRRVLPAPSRRMVGPFIFFDHFGPTELPPGEGMQVRPHPHIGLSTVSYLFEGEIMHRDSLGSGGTMFRVRSNVSNRPGRIGVKTVSTGCLVIANLFLCRICDSVRLLQYSLAIENE